MVVALVAALAQAALSATPSASAPATVAAKPENDKMICRTLPQTGSLFAGPKECHLKSEWNDLNAASRDGVSNFQQRIHQINLSKPGG